jgi:hypothetical protein
MNFFWGNGTFTEIISATVSMFASVIGATACLDCLGALYTAYKRACMRLDDEKWLLENCRDPTFFSKMRAHPAVCSEVETNARIGAFWTALKEVTDVVRVAWQPYIVGFAAAIVLLLPVCWICVSRVSSKCSTSIRCRRREWGESIPVHSDFRHVKNI